MPGTLGYAGRGRPCSKDWVALVKGALDSNLAYKETLLSGPRVLSSRVPRVSEQSGRGGAETVSFPILICAPKNLQETGFSESFPGKLSPSVASTPLRIFFSLFSISTMILL